MHPTVFHPKALQAIRLMPRTARRALGEAIYTLQCGARVGMPLSRPMPTVGPGVQELRVRDAAGIYRAFYLVKFQRGVLVFHAFQKKNQQTPQYEIQLGRQRLRELWHEQG